jgi:hypothetical protein
MNSKSDMNIAKALDIDLPIVEADSIAPSVPDPPTEATQGPTGYNNGDADTDYEEVRRNLKVVIEQSNSAIQGVLELAEDSQQPRAYEVVAQLIGQTLEANTKLIDLHRRMKDIKKQETIKQTNVTNNSIFVGSTTDLQKMLRDARKTVENEAKGKE